MPSTVAASHLLSNFFDRERDSRGPDWARELRRGGAARFEELGLPTTRLEQWRATNVAPLAETEFTPPPPSSATDIAERLPAVARLDLGGPRLVFLDGRLQRELSTTTLPAGVWVGSLAEALEIAPERVRPHLTRRDPTGAQVFDALNAALHEDGFVILTDAQTDGGAPLHVVFAASGGKTATAVHPRNVIAAGRGSRLQVVETYVGLDEGVYFTNSVTDVLAEDGAQVEHCRLQIEGPDAIHISNVHSRQTRDSRVTLHNLNLGGRLVRHDVVSVIDGEGAECNLNGLYVTRDSQHVDSHTVLDHAKPHGSSRELYKAILGDRSRTVFNGRIVVRQDAQKTDAVQSNPNLLLSDAAQAHTRPQLEIYADDVKCTHGATIGRLDEQAVFYLRSRGITERDARNLLIASFAGEVVQRLGIEALRTEVERVVDARLPRPSDT
jgi:Fe-S cluster assembly protein SufD